MSDKHITAVLNDTSTLPPNEASEKTAVFVSALVHRIQPYYRSKAFVSNIGINPLIAATSPLFFLIEKAQQSNVAPHLDMLREDLTHEIRAFETQAQTRGYPSQIILAARYILCLWVDEIILNTPWGKNGHWEKQILTDKKPSTLEKSFFSLLSHCLQDLPTYIDILELFYLCLSLGYEGEYRYTERGHILLSELKDTLYHRIEHYRTETIQPSDTSVAPTKNILKKKKSLRPVIAATTCALLLGITIIGYFLMDQRLAQQLLLHTKRLPSASEYIANGP